MPRTVLSRILLGCLLVLTVGLSTAWAQGDCPPGYHEAAGEFVDDDDLAVFHHIVHVALEDMVGF